MAELNTPEHRWYQGKNHVRLARDDYSKQYIFDSGLKKIDEQIMRLLGNYILDGVKASLIFDPANGVVGSRQLGIEDYEQDDHLPVLIFDPQNGMVGA